MGPSLGTGLGLFCSLRPRTGGSFPQASLSCLPGLQCGLSSPSIPGDRGLSLHVVCPRRGEPGRRCVAARDHWAWVRGTRTPPLERGVAGPWKGVWEGNSGVAIFGKCHLPQSLTGVPVYGVVCSPGTREALSSGGPWPPLVTTSKSHGPPFVAAPLSLGVVGGVRVS